MRDFLHKHKILLTLLPVLAIMIVIFCFSAQKAAESDNSSRVYVNWFIKLFYRNFESLSPDRQASITKGVSHYIRKTAHLTLYALLGFSLHLHFHCLSSKVRIRKPALPAFAAGFLYACSDELHQTFVEGRSGELADVMIDSAGVLLGILLLACVFRMIAARKKKKQP